MRRGRSRCVRGATQKLAAGEYEVTETARDRGFARVTSSTGESLVTELQLAP